MGLGDYLSTHKVMVFINVQLVYKSDEISNLNFGRNEMKMKDALREKGGATESNHRPHKGEEEEG